MKSLPFHIPEALKKVALLGGATRKSYYRGYTLGTKYDQ